MNDLARVEWARYLRLPGRPGLEALHATFVRHRYALHAHDTFTVAVMERGAATFELAGSRYVAPPGSVFVIPPHTPHTGESATPEGYTYRVLYLAPEELAAGLDARAGASNQVVLRDTRLTGALLRLHRCFVADPPGLESDELLIGALARLRPLLAERQTPPRRRHAAVQRARALLDERFTERVSLDQLARHCGLSRWHLSRTFRAAYGMPPSAYQRQLRIELARTRLAEGHAPARVAAECGYADQAHLTREFKRVVGVPPARFAGLA